MLPAGMCAWCHLCELGFKTLAELQQHNREKAAAHQKIMEKGRQD